MLYFIVIKAKYITAVCLMTEALRIAFTMRSFVGSDFSSYRQRTHNAATRLIAPAAPVDERFATLAYFSVS